MKLFCKGIGTDSPDMSNASRKIKSKEIKLCKNNGVTDITEVIVGLDGIAFTSSVKGKSYNSETIEVLNHIHAACFLVIFKMKRHEASES